MPDIIQVFLIVYAMGAGVPGGQSIEPTLQPDLAVCWRKAQAMVKMDTPPPGITRYGAGCVTVLVKQRDM